MTVESSIALIAIPSPTAFAALATAAGIVAVVFSSGLATPLSIAIIFGLTGAGATSADVGATCLVCTSFSYLLTFSKKPTLSFSTLLSSVKVLPL